MVILAKTPNGFWKNAIEKSPETKDRMERVVPQVAHGYPEMFFTMQTESENELLP